MTLVIQLNHPLTTNGCAICGAPLPGGDGPQLCTAGTADAVCRKCARQHAPSLAALLDLAHTAQRVARIGRHGVCPPYTALLDLARAAEDYSDSAARGRP